MASFRFPYAFANTIRDLAQLSQSIGANFRKAELKFDAVDQDIADVAAGTFVLCDGAPLMDNIADAGVSGEASRCDHVHPTDTSRAAVTDLTTETATRVLGDVKLNQRIDDLSDDFGVHHHDARYPLRSDLTTALALKVDRAGDTITGALLSAGSGVLFPAYASYVAGDLLYRFNIDSNGGMSWGSGAATVDTVLHRTAANTLSMGSGDKLQQNQSPSTGDDLTNKTYVDAGLSAHEAETGATAHGGFYSRGSADAKFVDVLGDTMTGDLNIVDGGAGTAVVLAADSIQWGLGTETAGAEWDTDTWDTSGDLWGGVAIDSLDVGFERTGVGVVAITPGDQLDMTPGLLTVDTQSPGDNSAKAASTAYADAVIGAGSATLTLADVKLNQRIDDLSDDFGVHHHDARYVDGTIVPGGLLVVTSPLTSSSLAFGADSVDIFTVGAFSSPVITGNGTHGVLIETTLYGPYISSGAAANHFDVFLWDGAITSGTIIGACQIYVAATGQSGGGRVVRAYLAPFTGTKTIRMAFRSGASSQTINNQASATTPTIFTAKYVKV